MMSANASESSWRNAGAVDTRNSPHAVLRSVPIGAVTMGDGFWKPRLDANRKAGIFGFLEWLDEDDQVAPFREFEHFARTGDDSRIAGGLDKMQRAFEGRNGQRIRHTWRATVMEVVEACAYTLQSEDDPAIRDLMDQLVTGIVAAHESDEFLKSYYGDEFEHSYQLGTPGHLIQAAVAHHRTTGETEFLEVAVAVADAVAAKFKGRAFAEHPGIEMALVELHRATGEARMLRLADHFVGLFRQQDPIIGPDTGEGNWRHFNRHVVRQTYLPCGAADLLAETEDPELWEHLLAIWRDMTVGKLQIIGQLATDYWLGERITTEPYALSVGVFGCLQDHISHGFELCEAVGNIMWNWRMLALTADASYADHLERTLYNGLLGHFALDDPEYHYLGLMASDGDHLPRNPWGNPTTGCCPANAVRFIPSVPSYFFSTSDTGVWVHLYDDCRMDWRLADGSPISLWQATRYPWDGEVEIRIGLDGPAEFDLNLRIPGWCEDATVAVNGTAVEGPVERGSYHGVHRIWEDGDVVMLNLAMPVVGMEADPRAKDFQGKTALLRGPLVYCFEGVDNQDQSVRTIGVKAGKKIRPFEEGVEPESLYQAGAEISRFEAVDKPDLLGGVTVLRGPGVDDKASEITAVPYFAWANRGLSPMRIWIDALA
jgi:DUF1680 family protein